MSLWLGNFFEAIALYFQQLVASFEWEPKLGMAWLDDLVEWLKGLI